MHLFLCGKSGAGKSTAIQMALKALGVTPKGFYTRKLEESGRVELFHALEESARVTVATFDEYGKHPNPRAFDTHGVEALKGIAAGDIVVMDELGFLENDAIAFQRAVLETLSLPCRVLGVVKEQGSAFLDVVRDTEGVVTLNMHQDDRDEALKRATELLRVPPLYEALKVEKGVTAIVGGGGKTTLMLRLAKELSKKAKIIVCTTTHIRAPENMPLLIDASYETVQKVLFESPAVCVAEREAETGKLIRPKLSMEDLMRLADYVLVEADGSRGLPLKAHAAHEPQIPPEATRVLYVVGADGISKPVSEAAHRPELYAALLGKTTAHIVTPQDAAFTIKTIKNAVAVFNKVETAEALTHARRFARAYEGRVAVCSLQSERPVLELWENSSPLW